MPDRSIPAPRSWKDAIWRRFDRRFVHRDEVDGLNADISDLVVQLAKSAEERNSIGEQLDQRGAQQELFRVQLDEMEARFGELREHVGNAAERLREQALGDAQDIVAIWAMLSPDRPLPALGGWALAPDAARYLVERVLQGGPEHIIECGSGSSTVLLAMALERVGRGKLTTLEHDLEYLGRTKDLFAEYDLTDWVDLVHAPLDEVEVDGVVVDWYQLPDSWPAGRTFDLVLVDGPPSMGKRDRYPALPLLRPFLSDEAVLVIDDVSRPDEKTMVELWVDRYPEFVAEYLPHTKGTAVLHRHPRS